MKEDIDFTIADKVLIKDGKSDTIFIIGDKVALRIDVATQMPERIFKVEQVIIICSIISDSDYHEMSTTGN